jgi:hypothetical protein
MDSLTGVASENVRFTPESRPFLGQALRSANDPERTLSLGSLTFPHEQEVGAIIVAAIGGFIAGVALIFPMRQKDVALLGRGMKCS